MTCRFDPYSRERTFIQWLPVYMNPIRLHKTLPYNMMVTRSKTAYIEAPSVLCRGLHKSKGSEGGGGVLQSQIEASIRIRGYVKPVSVYSYNNMAAYGRVFDIIKSCEDKREYKGYELQNKMKVLLVSDPTTEKAAAAVDVNIGKRFLEQRS